MISYIQVTIEPYWGTPRGVPAAVPHRIELRINVDGKEHGVVKAMPSQFDFLSIFDILMEELKHEVKEAVRAEQSSTSKL